MSGRGGLEAPQTPSHGPLLVSQDLASETASDSQVALTSENWDSRGQGRGQVIEQELTEFLVIADTIHGMKTPTPYTC